MKRIVVIGTGGRLGAAIARHLRLSGHAVIGFDRKGLDLTSPAMIADRLSLLDFDAVIISGALTSLEQCLDEPDLARQTNAEGPQHIATIAAHKKARTIYISTDYVYDGSHPGRRKETDPTVPTSVYGQTKLAGEHAVQDATDGQALVLRVSWVFGPDRPAFPDQLITRALAGQPLDAIADKFSSPTYALDAAHIIERLICHYPEATGIYNLSNDGRCSWHEYGASALAHVAELGLKLRSHEIITTRLADMTHFRATRPIETATDIDKISTLLGERPRPWSEALRDYLQTYYAATS
jgi:dTDP-4-dehydrorhamnose reductase